jgi:hypothetical protein
MQVRLPDLRPRPSRRGRRGADSQVLDGQAGDLPDGAADRASGLAGRREMADWLS